jgi:hypothetical protein
MGRSYWIKDVEYPIEALADLLRNLKVFCVGLPVVFLHGLPYVKMVIGSVSIPLAMLTWLTHRLLYYTPPATVVRLLATNATIAWLTSYVLYLSGASEDPRMLLPAWVSITTVRPNLIRYNLTLEIDQSLDFDCTVPHHPTENQYQERDIGINQRLFDRQLH